MLKDKIKIAKLTTAMEEIKENLISVDITGDPMADSYIDSCLKIIEEVERE